MAEATHFLNLPQKHKKSDIRDYAEWHREWNWADEQGWIRCLRLPLSDLKAWGVRSSSNPILSPYTGGDRFDDKNVLQPCVVYYNGTYYLFYTGQRNSDSNYRLGLATATDPEGPYSRYDGDQDYQSLIDNDQSYDSQRAYQLSVIYDEYESSANKWKMWYTGYNGTTKVLCYAYASSPMGPWTKSASNPLTLANYVQGSGVTRLGSLYHMVYRDDSGGIGVATSKDGVNWARYGTVLNKGGAGEWDENEIGYCALFWNLGVWYLMYSGYDATDTKYRIGMATSSDGFNFTKWPLNPIWDVGAAGQWDEKYDVFPSLLMMDGAFYMWYEGKNNSNVQKIGVGVLKP